MHGTSSLAADFPQKPREYKHLRTAPVGLALQRFGEISGADLSHSSAEKVQTRVTTVESKAKQSPFSTICSLRKHEKIHGFRFRRHDFDEHLDASVTREGLEIFDEGYSSIVLKLLLQLISRSVDTHWADLERKTSAIQPWIGGRPPLDLNPLAIAMIMGRTEKQHGYRFKRSDFGDKLNAYIAENDLKLVDVGCSLNKDTCPKPPKRKMKASPQSADIQAETAAFQDAVAR
ncbi:hypothetical protein PRZ48_011937 [Zasmidium cellare]|uniref:Uncharacterized protein n=1 Tax=Zasmidium cellare TaxID=395010 RepID=A0ABR0E8E2_ZASCE|nr:hypothetical protein PRZ48_011937 [Zasmidium cellare]